MAPAKLPDVQDEVRRLLDEGFYYETVHARQRMDEMRLRRTEVKHVLRTGARDAARDEYDWDKETWKYVVQGETRDRQEQIRVVFSITTVPPLSNVYVAVVTVIEP